ncbi:MAG TPA: EamA family transporter [Methyloceanibacter sp.]|jgi:drug/metabolite transporter (DMT)-like permease|nr:EamA family transporter [Methyloceanibacter sp.]
MISALLGLASALGLGTADFMARFSARALGATLTYAVVLLIGAVGTTVLILVTGAELVWSAYGCAIAVLHGISVSVMCILLYEGMARGPIAVVAPIVATHPVPVLAVNVLMGVRPSAVEWIAMAIIIVGGVLISRHAISEAEPAEAKANRTTVLIALGACLAYVAIVLTAQAATPVIGEIETMWIGRWAGLAFIVLALVAQGVRLQVPSNWWPFVGLQGGLDSLGYLAFLAGANTAAPHVTMVVASAFSVVTVLLARVVIKEQVTPLQWAAIALIALGTAVLSGT